MEHLRGIGEYVDLDFDGHQVEQLSAFGKWLIDEAIPAGGIGPHEADRIALRHIGDSLLFARFFRDADEIWDLGSGVGLPGIPLAIALPGARFVLVDRSGRRSDLSKRAVRVVGLRNVEVRRTPIESVRGPIENLVTRASLPPEVMTGVVERLLRPGGTAVMGGSWIESPDVAGWESVEVPSGVLDRPVWILIMRKP